MFPLDKYGWMHRGGASPLEIAWEKNKDEHAARGRLAREAPELRRREVAALERLAGIEHKESECTGPKRQFFRTTIEIEGQLLDVDVYR